MPPSLYRQFRLFIQFIHIAHAKISDDFEMIGYGECLSQRIFVIDAYPADTDSLGAGGKPEVLYRANGRIEVHPRIVRAPEHDLATPCMVAGHAQIDRCLANAFQFERTISRSSLAEKISGASSLALLKI